MKPDYTKAELEVDVTDNLQFTEEIEEAIVHFEYPGALSEPKIVISFENAEVEVDLDDVMVDKMADFTYRIQELKREGNQR